MSNKVTGMTECWKSLVKGAQKGEKQALQAIALRYGGVVDATIRNMTLPNMVSARDITQDVWLRVLTKIGTFKGTDCDSDAVFRAWLRTTANRVALNVLAVKNVDIDVAGAEERIPADDPTPSSQTRRAEREEQVREALRELENPKQEQVLVLRYIESKTLDQTAAITGLTKDQVRYLIDKTESKLRHLLKDLMD